MRIAVKDFHANLPEGALKKIAASVQVYLACEHDEYYDDEMVERAVREWFAREVEILLADGAELLTAPRHGHAHRLRQRIYDLNGRRLTATDDFSLRQAA